MTPVRSSSGAISHSARTAAAGLRPSGPTTWAISDIRIASTSRDHGSMAWWATQPGAWAATRQKCRDPADVMPEYVRWLKGLPGKVVFVAYPVAYDFMFVYWYMIRFAGESPFSHSALDIKTLVMAALGTDYRESVKRNMPKEWFEKLPHNHLALDDAIGQGVLFCNALAELRRKLGRAE